MSIGTPVAVLAIDHRYGTDISAYTDRAAALKSLAEFVANWWDEVAGREDAPDTMPSDIGEAIDIYFDISPDSYIIEETTIQ